MLAPLRARTHSPLRWDEQYVPYLRRAGMLPLARVVCAGLPAMDAPLLTTFVDRWRPETHSFHLPCGEVSITLQDVAMILGLPLEGIAVTGIIQTDGWRDMVEALIGIRPPGPPERRSNPKLICNSHEGESREYTISQLYYITES